MKHYPHPDEYCVDLDRSARQRDLAEFYEESFYLLEECRSQTFEWVPAVYASPIFKSTPMVLYLQGLFAILLCFSRTSMAMSCINEPIYVLLFQTAIPALMLLFGYAIINHTGDVDPFDFSYAFFHGYFPPIAIRILIPSVLIYIIYLIQTVTVGGQTITFTTLVADFISGNYGDGGYIGMMLLQFLIFFPLIVKGLLENNDERHPMWGLLYILEYALVYELLVVAAEMNTPLYRFIFLRYLFTFALGIYIYFRRNEKKRWWTWVTYIIFTAIGIIYLLFVQYQVVQNDGMVPDWFPMFHAWPYTSLFACFYIYPVIATILYLAKEHRLPKFLHALFAVLGNSWFYIVLVQAIYFGFNLHIGLGLSDFLADVADTAFCVIVGILFYLLLNSKALSGSSVAVLNLKQALKKLHFEAGKKVQIIWFSSQLRFVMRMIEKENLLLQSDEARRNSN